jgi:protein-tyrosine phosphatase
MHLLGGAKNFRAVRPYEAAGGRRLKPDTIFRSGELSRLTDSDLATMRALNIRLVCDLRSDGEQAEYLSRWPDGHEYRQLDLPERDAAAASPDKIFAAINSLPGEDGAVLTMNRLYRRKPRAMAPSLAALFADILAGDAMASLVHCHAGKDRTGFVVAILLAALGVALADIHHDYALTSQFFEIEDEAPKTVAWAKRSFGFDISLEAARPLNQARPEYLAAALDEIDRSWGGMSRYLTEAVGLTDQQLKKLQDMLLG